MRVSVIARSPKHLGLLALLATLAGCSTTVDVTRVAVPLPAGTGPVSLTVVDSRTAQDEPSWLGVVRSSGALPFDVHTTSGQPLAKDMTSALAHSFAEAGYTPTDPAPAVPGYVLELFEWSSDGYFGTLTLRYRLILRVLRAGREVGEVQRSGEFEAVYELRSRYASTCQRLFTDVLTDLFAEARKLPRGIDPPAESPSKPGTACKSCKKILENDWKVCPVCATPR